MTKELNVTEKERAVLDIIVECMNLYQDGFSDIRVEDLVSGTGFSTNTVKGILGSLDKKNMIDYMDVNGEYNVYYVAGKAESLLNFELEF